MVEDKLTRGAVAIGLSKAPRKCGILWQTPTTAQETAQLLGMPNREKGFMITGYPTRTSALVTRVSRCHAAKVRVLLGTLNHFPQGSQGQFLLLRKSLVLGLKYVTRMGPVSPEGGDGQHGGEDGRAMSGSGARRRGRPRAGLLASASLQLCARCIARAICNIAADEQKVDNVTLRACP
jgi:hypothetical protein